MVVALVLAAAALTAVLPREVQTVVFHTPLLIAVLVLGTAFVLWRILRAPEHLRPAAMPDQPHVASRPPLAARGADLEQLGRETWDVLIVGGGIVGCGALLDAASRGLRAALIEQEDIAVGTSSRSSRLIHGGLRYLEQFHVGLVREALHERARLLRAGSAPRAPREVPVPAVRVPGGNALVL